MHTTVFTYLKHQKGTKTGQSCPPLLYTMLLPLVILIFIGHHNEPQKASKRGRRRRGPAMNRGDLQAGIEQLETNTFEVVGN